MLICMKSEKEADDLHEDLVASCIFCPYVLNFQLHKGNKETLQVSDLSDSLRFGEKGSRCKSCTNSSL